MKNQRFFYEERDSKIWFPCGLKRQGELVVLCSTEAASCVENAGFHFVSCDDWTGLSDEYCRRIAKRLNPSDLVLLFDHRGEDCVKVAQKFFPHVKLVRVALHDCVYMLSRDELRSVVAWAKPVTVNAVLDDEYRTRLVVANDPEEFHADDYSLEYTPAQEPEESRRHLPKLVEIDANILLERNLSPDALRVYIGLELIAKKNGSGFIHGGWSLLDITGYSGLERFDDFQHLAECLKELEEAGYIRVEGWKSVACDEPDRIITLWWRF